MIFPLFYKGFVFEELYFKCTVLSVHLTSKVYILKKYISWKISIVFYPASLAHLFVVKKMFVRFASLHFLSLQKMCLRLLFSTDSPISLFLPLENILRCARTCLLRKNASIFIVVNCALTSIPQSRSSHGSSRVLFIFLRDYNDKIIKISWHFNAFVLLFV